jgi:hypothetical protein
MEKSRRVCHCEEPKLRGIEAGSVAISEGEGKSPGPGHGNVIARQGTCRSNLKKGQPVMRQALNWVY